MRLDQRLQPLHQAGLWRRRISRAVLFHRTRHPAQQRGAQAPQHQRTRLSPARELLPDLAHGLVQLWRRRRHGGPRQVAPHIAHAHKNLVHQFIGQRGHPALRVLRKAKRVHMPLRHVDERTRKQRHPLAVQVRHAPARGDQQHLVQPRVPVRRQLPVVQCRTLGNRLAVQHIGQVLRLAKQAVRADAIDVRKVHVLAPSVHSTRRLCHVSLGGRFDPCHQPHRAAHTTQRSGPG